MYDASHENIPLKFTWVHFTLFGGRTLWDNGADLAPEFLLDLLHQQRAAA